MSACRRRSAHLLARTRAYTGCAVAATPRLLLPRARLCKPVNTHWPACSGAGGQPAAPPPWPAGIRRVRCGAAAAVNRFPPRTGFDLRSHTESGERQYAGAASSSAHLRTAWTSRRAQANWPHAGVRASEATCRCDLARETRGCLRSRGVRAATSHRPRAAHLTLVARARPATSSGARHPGALCEVGGPRTVSPLCCLTARLGRRSRSLDRGCGHPREAAAASRPLARTLAAPGRRSACLGSPPPRRSACDRA